MQFVISKMICEAHAVVTRRTFAGRAAAAILGVAALASISCADGGRDYIDPSVISIARVIPAPPLAGSAAERAELNEMLAVQAQRTPAQAERAKADADVDIFRFADALGSPPEFTAAKLPKCVDFFERIRRAESAVVRPAKDYYARVRPYETEPKLAPVISRVSSLSYPSGHSMWAWTAGLVLADMLPEKRTEILARAAEFAQNRVVAGVHYPSDVAEGRVAGSVLAAFLFASPAFSADEKLAAEELRSALKYPPRH